MSLLKRIEKERQSVTQETPSGMGDLRTRRRPATGPRDAYVDLKTRIQNKLIADLDPTMDVFPHISHLAGISRLLTVPL